MARCESHSSNDADNLRQRLSSINASSDYKSKSMSKGHMVSDTGWSISGQAKLQTYATLYFGKERQQSQQCGMEDIANLQKPCQSVDL